MRELTARFTSFYFKPFEVAGIYASMCECMKCVNKEIESFYCFFFFVLKARELVTLSIKKK